MTKASVSFGIAQGIRQVSGHRKTIPNISDHERLLHGPGIVTDDEPFDTRGSLFDGTIVIVQTMILIHRLTLGEDGILPLIPVGAVLAAETEDEVWLLADFDAVVVHRLTATADIAEEVGIKSGNDASISDSILQHIFETLRDLVLACTGQIKILVTDQGEGMSDG